MSLAVKAGTSAHPVAQGLPDRDNIDTSHEIRRLHRNAVTLVSAHPDTIYLGPDSLVESMARHEGFASTDLAILRVLIAASRHTLICVPERIWHGPSSKLRLITVRRTANRAGRNAILVPETFIQRQPRLSNSRAIEAASNVVVTAEHRMAVLVHLIENGYSTLYDCACAINHESPFSCVLHLVSIGALRMDHRRALSPHTRIDLPEVGSGSL